MGQGIRQGMGCALALVQGLWAGQLPADSIDISGPQPWEGCGYCHGSDGISAVATFPHLAGQDETYLRRQLEDFRSGQRQNDRGVMGTQAEALDGAAIAGLARYFAAQKAPAARVSMEPGTAAVLYRQGDPARDLPACRSCHDRGVAGIPRLGGQHADYLAKQLEDFAAGRRSSVPSEVPGTGPGVGNNMRAIAAALTMEERLQLSTYLAGAGGSEIESGPDRE